MSVIKANCTCKLSSHSRTLRQFSQTRRMAHRLVPAHWRCH